MSGPSVKVSATWLNSDRIEDLDAGTVLLMISALGWSADQTTNGLVPRRTLRKLWPVADVDAAIDQLIKAGEVEDHGDRLLFVRWADFILSEDEVDEIRAGSRERSERSRRHKRGDHTMCRPSYCRAAARDLSRDASRDGDVTVRVSDGHPIRPDPTRPQGRGGEGGAAEPRSARAPRSVDALAGDPHLTVHEFPYDDIPGYDPDQDQLCPFCDLPEMHMVHQAHDFVPFQFTEPELLGTCGDCFEKPENPVHHWHLQQQPA
jgi:hypothetical protein